MPQTEQQSLWSAFHAARHAVTPLTANEAAMPHNEGVKYFTFNPGQHLTARFLDGGVRIESSRNDNWAGTLRFTTADDSKPPEPTFTKSADNRVEYQHPGGIIEWYVNRGEGIEHGFTVHTRPDEAQESGELRLTFALEGLEARPVADAADTVDDSLNFVDPMTGRALLRYAGLKVWDASGQAFPARLEAHGTEVGILVAEAGAIHPLTIDPLVTSLEGKLEPEFDGDGAANDEFGSQVALSGDTALIGVQFDDTATGENAGSVYVFVRAGTQWLRQAKLYSPQAEAYDFFGSRVALSGDTALIASSIKAHVFVRAGGTWLEQARLHPDDGLDYWRSFSSLALSDDTAVFHVHSFTGTPTFQSVKNVFVFVREGTNWSQQAELAANWTTNSPNPKPLAIDGDTVVVGELGVGGGEPIPAGAYVFVRNGTTWSQQAKLTPNDPSAAPLFGHAVSVAGDTVVVGAPGNYVFPQVNGSAYVFGRTGTNWIQQTKLTSSNLFSITYGWSVAMSGDTILVGVSGDDSFNPENGEWRYDHGSAYVFRVPYDLTAFVESVQPLGNAVLVQCTGEPGFSYDVERSPNAVSWTGIHTITSPVHGDFDYTDTTPPLPMSVYRLKRNLTNNQRTNL